VKVLRKNLLSGKVNDLDITYTPREWAGNGFLGCVLKFSPLN